MVTTRRFLTYRNKEVTWLMDKLGIDCDSFIDFLVASRFRRENVCATPDVTLREIFEYCDVKIGSGGRILVNGAMHTLDDLDNKVSDECGEIDLNGKNYLQLVEKCGEL